MSFYKNMVSSSWYEEELWLRLDHIAEIAMSDPYCASQLAYNLFIDSSSFKDVRIATLAILEWCRANA